MEVEIDPHFNQDSKYWLEYNNKYQIKHVPNYIQYMNSITNNLFNKLRIVAVKQEIEYG